MPLPVKTEEFPTHFIAEEITRVEELLECKGATANMSRAFRMQDAAETANREDLIQFTQSNNNRNLKRVLVSGDTSFGGQPYILHTTNEFYATPFGDIAYDNTEKFHIVGLRTGPATASASPTSGLKVVYYYEWDDTYSSPPVFNPTTQPTATYSEYYTLTTDPGETTNNSSMISSAIHTTLSGVITGELQASMGTVNGVNLDTVLTTARATYNAYMSPPTGLSVSPATPVHNPSAPVSISITGTNIQRGSTVSILAPSGSTQTYITPDTVDTSVNPIVVPAIFPTNGNYEITVVNPSKAKAEITIYVS